MLFVYQQLSEIRGHRPISFERRHVRLALVAQWNFHLLVGHPNLYMERLLRFRWNFCYQIFLKIFGSYERIKI